MKKLAITLSVVFCLLLSACGGGTGGPAGAGGTGGETPGTPAQLRPFEEGDVTALVESAAISDELEAVDTDLVCGLFNLSEDAITGCVGYLSTGSSAEEVVLFTVAEGALEQVQKACEWRIEEQTFGYKDYMPDEVPKLENTIVEVRDNTVLFVVAADWEAAAALIGEMK